MSNLGPLIPSGVCHAVIAAGDRAGYRQQPSGASTTLSSTVLGRGNLAYCNSNLILHSSPPCGIGTSLCQGIPGFCPDGYHRSSGVVEHCSAYSFGNLVPCDDTGIGGSCPVTRCTKIDPEAYCAQLTEGNRPTDLCGQDATPTNTVTSQPVILCHHPRSLLNTATSNVKSVQQEQAVNVIKWWVSYVDQQTGLTTAQRADNNRVWNTIMAEQCGLPSVDGCTNDPDNPNAHCSSFYSTATFEGVQLGNLCTEWGRANHPAADPLVESYCSSQCPGNGPITSGCPMECVCVLKDRDPTFQKVTTSFPENPGCWYAPCSPDNAGVWIPGDINADHCPTSVCEIINNFSAGGSSSINIGQITDSSKCTSNTGGNTGGGSNGGGGGGNGGGTDFRWELLLVLVVVVVFFVAIWFARRRS